MKFLYILIKFVPFLPQDRSPCIYLLEVLESHYDIDHELTPSLILGLTFRQLDCPVLLDLLLDADWAMRQECHADWVVPNAD